ncbi:hypothetical protein MNAN1_002870 [Malassezia nana]|uniref:F-box protein Hrt3/FBXO9 C-terminal domain-containing protein n=1 Tax=Malassezia nana TaxID=180528 RepID=A0AAF0J3B7_9BASI|nr:hypothetical protein MNAN1_002870 [Malassezia nana]
MDAELQAFRSQWRDEVAARQRPACHASVRSSDAGLRASSTCAPSHGATSPRSPSPTCVQPDSLGELLHTLAEGHADSVARHAAELDASTDDEENLAARLGDMRLATSVHDIYPADATQPVPAARVPDEVWLFILLQVAAPTPVPLLVPAVREHQTHVPEPGEPWRATTGPDYVALERLGRVCWRLRRLSAHPQVWKAVVQATYEPPLERVPCSWRDAFVHEPRVRMNGTYIATCQYTQQGLSVENVWVRVLHTVQFFRYLRFFPNGRCLSWLTTEAPADAVRQLVPGLRAKGCAAGRWHLLREDGAPPARRGATIVIDDLRDPQLRGYAFQMTLHLRASPGRWHRLDMLAYSSLNLQTAEVVPIPHKHASPFVFSRVVGYGV